MDQLVFTDWTNIIHEYQMYKKRWESDKEGYIASIFKKVNNRFGLVDCLVTSISNNL